MKVVSYASLTEPDLARIWHDYFKTTSSVTTDYNLACIIEKSLFDYGVDKVAVLVFIDDEGDVRGILPISHEKVTDVWSYYPSYIFISMPVTMDDVCWPSLPSSLPRPFIIHESSFKAQAQTSWVTQSQANVINLTPYKSFECYLADLEKKIRSRFRNCLNRNQDVVVTPTNVYDVAGGEDLRQSYLDYCATKFEDAQDLSYFQNQLAIFPDIFNTAARLGHLVTLQFHLDEQIVALNYSIIENDCLYDYICYRAAGLDKRALGIFAILKNIEFLLHMNKDEIYYDLASEFSYKKQFIPASSLHYRQCTLRL